MYICYVCYNPYVHMVPLRISFAEHTSYLNITITITITITVGLFDGIGMKSQIHCSDLHS